MNRYSFFLLLTSFQVLSAENSTLNVKITQISAYEDGRAVLVQTTPRHDIQGLSCTNDYWLILQTESVAYDTILSMLLSANASQKNVHVTADDNISGEFCRLNRITIME